MATNRRDALPTRDGVASELIEHDHVTAAAVRRSALAPMRFESVSDRGDDPLSSHAVHVGERE